jgi:hypothetical protein
MEGLQMALWRDPLDELIDDLESTLPHEKTTDVAEIQRALAEQQWAVGVLLWGLRGRTPCVMHTQRFHDAVALKG